MSLPKTGISKIDRDHREMMIYLYQMGTSSEGADLEVFSEYLKNHLRSEEDLMREFQYPEIASHVLEHQRLEDLFLNLQNSEILFNPALLSQAITHLSKELLNHIKTLDLDLGVWIQKRG